MTIIFTRALNYPIELERILEICMQGGVTDADPPPPPPPLNQVSEYA